MQCDPRSRGTSCHIFQALHISRECSGHTLQSYKLKKCKNLVSVLVKKVKDSKTDRTEMVFSFCINYIAI